MVPVAEVQMIRPHPNADRLEIAEILGWQLVVAKGEYQVGDRVVYVPPDAMVPPEVSDSVGVTKYLSKGRVRAARLRGEPSYGFTLPAPVGVALGTNLADALGIRKYEPPVKAAANDAVPDHPLFERYTEVENLRNFPRMFRADELVVVTEKIHGANCRAGIVEGERMAGSHKLRRARPADLRASIYWLPFQDERVVALLGDLAATARQVILYGEVYGRLQKLHYGVPKGLAFRAFDLYVDGRYLDAAEFFATCERHEVPTVPRLWEGPFGELNLKAVAEGPTAVAGGEHYREGLVVRPAVERHDPALGRIIGKYLSDTYLTGGVEDEAHD
jgi:RNA ligase (TIGR02306 family)